MHSESLCSFYLAGGGSVTTQLNEADMEIMGDGACAAIWGSSFRADVHICITSPGQDKGSCNVCKISIEESMFHYIHDLLINTG